MSERHILKTAIIDYLGVFRSTPHATTGMTPAELQHGCWLRNHQDIVSLPSKVFFQQPALARNSYMLGYKSSSSQRNHTDSKRGARIPRFREGDYARLHKPTVVGKAGLSYSPPSKIVKQLGPDTFRLEDGRSWNASKLVTVPTECPAGGDRQPLHFLPIPRNRGDHLEQTVEASATSAHAPEEASGEVEADFCTPHGMNIDEKTTAAGTF